MSSAFHSKEMVVLQANEGGRRFPGEGEGGKGECEGEEVRGREVR